MRRFPFLILGLGLLFLALKAKANSLIESPASQANEQTPLISFDQDIRPILQERCQGCHQSAKSSGGYNLTTYAQLFEKGESGEKPIVAGSPSSSLLVAKITVHDGQAEMPPQGDPLSEEQISKISRWIEQGALDDSPSNTALLISRENPPVYQTAPVINALDFSPDGSLLAVSGFHETLLIDNSNQQQVARLIGLSERIESLNFSPDGSRLAVSGGNPGRQGEIQIWNVASHELERSIPVSSDTLFGIAWSPDGNLVSIGATDNSVRAFDIRDGQQVFFNGVHDDWPLDTIFSTTGNLLVSVGRDMSTKLYDVKDQRFIDNVTSITPGALKGGISAIAKHPERDEILVGGADGITRIYRMERLTSRVIGDDANLIRRLPAIPGRITSVAYSKDATILACLSSHDGRGHLQIYRAETTFEMPEEIRKIVEKVAGSQSAEERATLENFVTQNVDLLSSVTLPNSLYAVAFDPKDSTVLVGGGDGKLRRYSAESGTLLHEFLPVVLTTPEAQQELAQAEVKFTLPEHTDDPEISLESSQLASLQLGADQIELNGPYDTHQVLVTGLLANGEMLDLTRRAVFEIDQPNFQISPTGRVFARSKGTGILTVRYGELTRQIPMAAHEFDHQQPIDFVKDVNPVLTRLGCNQGTCHGANDGKNGFKLSLRGYDPIFDTRSFTDDLKGRRVTVASPDDSLLLLKASGKVPHVGGVLTRPGEAYYETIREWIEQGAKLDLTTPRVTSINIQPENPIVQRIGDRQQLRVVATFSDGSTRDVTGDAFLESGNTEVAESNRSAIVTSLRRGEAPILARYEGSYAATTLTVMGNREGFEWSQPETWSEIDRLVAQKWERMKIEPSELCSDEEFLRRVHLDLTGLPPSPEEVVAFLQDTRPVREKRDEVIDRLIGSNEYIDYWTNKWADLLQVNSKFLGPEGATLFRQWIRENVAENRPYNEFSYDILTASGSNKENPASSYYKILRTPDELVENSTHLFLGVRFNCNKCHDHPFEKWTQDQYYQTAAYFAQFEMQRDPQNPDGNIGGTDVESPKPYWEVISDTPEGELKHERTGEVAVPLVPFDRDFPQTEGQTRRQQLAAWMTSSENDYFAKSYANRLWGYMLGQGLIEPLDDIRAGNPPSNPELLNYLTERFVSTNFNPQELLREICKSRVYQLSVKTNHWNEDDVINFSHALPKRLPAEVLYDTVFSVTGSKLRIPGVPEGTRAAALPDVKSNLADGFLENLGRPVRESACECERSGDLQLGPVMALMNGPTVSEAISQPGNRLEHLANSGQDFSILVNEVFLSVLNRPAKAEEIQVSLELLGELPELQKSLLEERASYQAQIGPVLETRAQQRQEKIAQAHAELNRYQQEIQPQRDQMEAERVAKVGQIESAIDEFLKGSDARAEEWAKEKVPGQTPWVTIIPSTLTTTNGSVLTPHPDGTVLTSGPNGVGKYLLSGELPVQQIGAIRLDALTDPSLPGNGPGRGGGNFVLSEFSVEIWPVDQPDQRQKLKLINPKADFEQPNYPIVNAIDGVVDAGGWAISGQTGQPHFATFEVETPLELTGAYQYEIVMEQHYPDGQHNLGKFMVRFTDAIGTPNTGVSQDVVLAYQTPVEQRSVEQKRVLSMAANADSAELTDLKRQLNEALRPLTEDTGVTERKNTIEIAEQPLPADPHLERLERAVTLGEQQLQNSQLTAIQDLTWALINSPAFLFNR